jgi:lipopolysaccharide export system protein LptC
MITKKKIECFFVLLLFVVMFVFTACVKSKKGKIEGVKTVFDQTINKFTVVQTKMGKEEWKLEAQTAKIDEKEESCIVYKPWVEIYDEGNMEVEGNVEIHSLVNDIKIRTQKIRWDSKKELIISDDFIEEERENVFITGWGLEATPDLNKIVIKRDIKVRIRGK